MSRRMTAYSPDNYFALDDLMPVFWHHMVQLEEAGEDISRLEDIHERIVSIWPPNDLDIIVLHPIVMACGIGVEDFLFMCEELGEGVETDKIRSEGPWLSTLFNALTGDFNGR